MATARAAAAALRQEWCGSQPEALVDAGGEAVKIRLSRLYQFLASGKLEVKVLPDQYFGLIHGKAGVITLADGTKTAFVGSVNESKSAWTLNYELMWEDPSPEAVKWVQEEFDALWTHHAAVPLAEFIEMARRAVDERFAGRAHRDLRRFRQVRRLAERQVHWPPSPLTSSKPSAWRAQLFGLRGFGGRLPEWLGCESAGDLPRLQLVRPGHDHNGSKPSS